MKLDKKITEISVVNKNHIRKLSETSQDLFFPSKRGKQKEGRRKPPKDNFT